MTSASVLFLISAIILTTTQVSSYRFPTGFPCREWNHKSGVRSAYGFKIICENGQLIVVIDKIQESESEEDLEEGSGDESNEEIDQKNNDDDDNNLHFLPPFGFHGHRPPHHHWNNKNLDLDKLKKFLDHFKMNEFHKRRDNRDNDNKHMHILK